MAVSRHPSIAKEGWSLILFSSFIVAVLQHYVSHYAAVLWCVPLVLLWLYRDPHRSLPSDPLGLVSPVNGTIIVAEAHPDPFLGRDAFLFRVSMSLTDIYSIRSVTEGKIIQQWLDPEDDDDDRSLAHAIQIKTDENDDIMIVLRPGRFFKQLSCDAVIGQRIGQGHRCGIIPFGSCVDIYVPAGSVINVKVGDIVEAGTSLLASLKHHS
jgi:phosphatidylserine decarboxylase